jgi:hypothetical protein
MTRVIKLIHNQQSQIVPGGFMSTEKINCPKKLVDGLQCSLNELIVATGRQSSTGEDEPRLSFTQTKRPMEILQCSLDELVAAMERNPPQEGN